MLNISWIYLAQAQATAGADLAALSALEKAKEAQDDAQEIEDARQLAAEVLRLNQVGLNALSAQPERIEFGRLQDASVHNPVFVKDEQANRISSARVLRDPDFKVPVFLGNFLGQDQVSISAPAVTSFRPTECILCLDASRSMHRTPDNDSRSFAIPPGAGSRWEILTQRVTEFLADLEDQNPFVKVGLVTFGGGLPGHPAAQGAASPLDADRTRHELPLQRVRTSAPQVISLMQEYTQNPLGIGTFTSDSLEQSIDVLEAGDPTSNKIIILLGDGLQFTQIAGHPLPVEAAERASSLGITVHTVNFQNVQNQELEDVSNEANGVHFDAGSNDELRIAFQELLTVFSVRLAD